MLQLLVCRIIADLEIQTEGSDNVKAWSTMYQLLIQHICLMSPRLASRQGGQIAIALQSLEGLLLISIIRLRLNAPSQSSGNVAAWSIIYVNIYQLEILGPSRARFLVSGLLWKHPLSKVVLLFFFFKSIQMMSSKLLQSKGGTGDCCIKNCVLIIITLEAAGWRIGFQ